MKKLGCFLIILVGITCFSTSVMAAENTVVTSNETEKNEIVAQELTYQDVLDKLNAEYGTNAHFPEEKENSGDSYRKSDLTPEEFEERIRYAIELNLAANAEADEGIKRMTEGRIDERRSFVASEWSAERSDGKLILTRAYDMDSDPLVVAGADYYYSNTKSLEGIDIGITAAVNCDRGFWAFSRVLAISYEWPPLTEIVFSPVQSTLVETYADSRRTYSIEIYGVVEELLTGVIIEDFARRYVEFWAGSGMPDPSTLVA